MVITHNMSAMNANRMYGVVNGSLSKSTEKLSSGYRINRSADDAAGLSISEKMRKMVKGLSRGATNTEDGISMVQVADGALHEVSDMFNRLEELAVQAANGTNQKSDRIAIQDEIQQIQGEIDRIAKTTIFNEKKLFVPDANVEKLHMDLAYSKSYLHTGHFSEVYYSPNSGDYYPAATIDFKELDEYNINDLVGREFSFTDKSGESITVKFNNSGAEGLLGANVKDRTYNVDLTGVTTPTQVVDKLVTVMSAVPGQTYSAPITVPNLTEGAAVSKSNRVVADGTRFTIFSADDGCASMEEARSKYNANSGVQASINCESMIRKRNATEMQVGIHCSGEAEDKMIMTIEELNTRILGIDDMDVTTQEGARFAIDQVAEGQAYVNALRAKLGAYQNRLEHTNANLNNTAENTQASESRIRDTDMADEMVRNTKDNILLQAGQSMIAQANQQHNGVMTLLGA